MKKVISLSDVVEAAEAEGIGFDDVLVDPKGIMLSEDQSQEDADDDSEVDDGSDD